MGKRIIVIGAGAAGLMAAAAAAGNGHSVTILEKNEKAGKKIYITGKGRCNLTNDCSTEDFFAHVARSRKFLYSAVYGFDQEQVKVFFTENGCPVKVERGNRVFPVSDHASDVTAALLRETGRKGVRILYHTAAESILAEQAGGDGLQVQGVRLKDGRTMPADAVILCTGGLSYPSTGSTGDGLVMARALGLQVTETAPSLVPFETKEMWCRELQGLALRNVAVRIFPLPKQEGGDDRREPAGEAGTEPGKDSREKSIGDTGPERTKPAGDSREKSIGDAGPERTEPAGDSREKSIGDAKAELTEPGEDTRGESIQDARTVRKKTGRKKKKNKPVYEAFGELLFTHFGLSGPIILTASCYCDFHENPQGFRLFLDLKPALSTEQLRERLRREFSLAPNRHLPAAVRPLFPARLAEAVTMLTGLETDRRAASFTEREIAGMASLIKEIPVTITGTRGYAEAIVTRGGISVTEFNPSTMESKKVRGLYAAGEVLDVDAETGGFNLQIAWSTGHLAGSSV